MSSRAHLVWHLNVHQSHVGSEALLERIHGALTLQEQDRSQQLRNSEVRKLRLTSTTALKSYPCKRRGKRDLSAGDKARTRLSWRRTFCCSKADNTRRAIGLSSAANTDRGRLKGPWVGGASDRTGRRGEVDAGVMIVSSVAAEETDERDDAVSLRVDSAAGMSPKEGARRGRGEESTRLRSSSSPARVLTSGGAGDEAMSLHGKTTSTLVPVSFMTVSGSKVTIGHVGTYLLPVAKSHSLDHACARQVLERSPYRDQFRVRTNLCERQTA